jgi:hypothetical protein
MYESASAFGDRASGAQELSQSLSKLSQLLPLSSSRCSKLLTYRAPSNIRLLGGIVHHAQWGYPVQ